MKELTYYTVCIVLFLALAACSTTAKIWKPYDKIRVETTDSINPDMNNRPSPIQVKIYELSSRTTFDNLDFDRAFYEAKTFLSDELISNIEYTIQPSESINHKVNLSNSTHFIAILAGFINIDKSRWKHVYAVKPYGHYSRTITIDKNTITAGQLVEESNTEDADAKKKKQSPDFKSLQENIEKSAETLEKANSTKESIKSLL